MFLNFSDDTKLNMKIDQMTPKILNHYPIKSEAK